MGDEGKTAGKTEGETQAEAAAAAAAAAASSSETSSGQTRASQGEDWEKRFKGLQPVHQQTVEELKELKGSFANEKTTWLGEKSQLEIALQSAQKELEKTKGEVISASKGTEELQKTVDQLEVRLERQTLIMSEFPELAVLEARGLIRQDVQGDELTKVLNEMRSVMVETGQKARKSLAVGATGDADHTTGGRTQPQSIGDIGTAMIKAVADRNMEEAARLEKLLIGQANSEVFGGGNK